MSTRNLAALLGAAALLALPMIPNASAAPSSKGAAIADSFHRRLRFRLQDASEADRQALESLLASGGLRHVVQAWEDTKRDVSPKARVHSAPEPTTVKAPPALRAPSPGTDSRGTTSQADLSRLQGMADKALNKKYPGFQWAHVRTYSRGVADEWVVSFRPRSKAGKKTKKRVEVVVDAATGSARVR